MKILQEIKIKTEFIKLTQLLKFCGEVQSGGEAKVLVLENLVKLNNEICTTPGKKVYPGDVVEFNQKTWKIVDEN